MTGLQRSINPVTHRVRQVYLVALLIALFCAPLPVEAGANRLPAPSFDLVDQFGARVTPDRFVGKPTVIFFGFTHCPDICPTTLTDMSNRLAELGDAAADLNVVFISVDPDRDTPGILKRYLGHFDGRIVGLTGQHAEIRNFANRIGASFKKVETGDGHYSMDHSVMHYLIDRQWRRIGVLYARSGAKGEQRTLKKLRNLIDDR